jgi:hypothetical protein
VPKTEEAALRGGLAPIRFRTELQALLRWLNPRGKIALICSRVLPPCFPGLRDTLYPRNGEGQQVIELAGLQDGGRDRD